MQLPCKFVRLLQGYRHKLQNFLAATLRHTRFLKGSSTNALRTFIVQICLKWGYKCKVKHQQLSHFHHSLTELTVFIWFGGTTGLFLGLHRFRSSICMDLSLVFILCSVTTEHLPSIICLGRLRIASKYIFNLWQLRYQSRLFGSVVRTLDF